MRCTSRNLIIVSMITLLSISLLLLSESALSAPLKSDGISKFMENTPPIAIPMVSFKTTEGRSITFDKFKGTWTLVNFWATWCAPCVSELPSLFRLQQSLKSPQFKILLISIDRGGAKVFAPFLKKIGLPSLYSASDPRAKVMRQLKLKGIPTTLLINPESRLVGTLEGSINWDSEAAQNLMRSFIQSK